MGLDMLLGAVSASGTNRGLALWMGGHLSLQLWPLIWTHVNGQGKRRLWMAYEISDNILALVLKWQSLVSRYMRDPEGAKDVFNILVGLQLLGWR